MEQIIQSRIIDIRNQTDYRSDVLYLLLPITSRSAFFYSDNKVIFGQSSINHIDKAQITTTYVSLVSSVYIHSISNNSTYPSGFYNLITYNGLIDEENFISFVELCNIYSKTSEIKFDDFFNAIIDIFQLPSNAKELNYIGFFGELSFIIELWKNHGIDISSNWHLDGSQSKCDFTSSKFNIEIKSTLRESSSFMIKHSQIFRNNKTYLVIVNLNQDGNYSLFDLINYCQVTHPFSENLNFHIKLNEEKLKIDWNNVKTKKLSINRISIFISDELETLSNIPDCINDIHYEYTFDLTRAYKLEEIYSHFS